MRTIIALPFFSNSSTDTESVLLVKNRNSTNPDYDFNPIGYKKRSRHEHFPRTRTGYRSRIMFTEIKGTIILLSCFQTERLKVTEGYCNVSLNQFKQKYTRYLDTLTSPRESL